MQWCVDTDNADRFPRRFAADKGALIILTFRRVA